MLVDPEEIIVSPSITSNYNGEHISCFNTSDGSVFATASGGTGSLDYAWSTTDVSQSVSGLPSGTYTVTVTDENDCTGVASIALTEPSEIDLSVVVTSDFNGDDVSCVEANDGEATANSTGGTGLVTYNWSNSFSGPINSNLGAGKYYVTATDINGCQTVDSILINDPLAVSYTHLTLPTICSV